MLDEGGTAIGFIVEWTGFENLFEDWEAAIAEAPGSPDPLWAIYANLYDPTYNYTVGDLPRSAPGFRGINRYFLSIARLNEILSRSWTLIPTSRYMDDTYGTTISTASSGGSSLGILAGMQKSWQMIWGGALGGLDPWSYDITPETPVETENAVLRLFISVDEVGSSLATLDPASFSVKD